MGGVKAPVLPALLARRSFSEVRSEVEGSHTERRGNKGHTSESDIRGRLTIRQETMNVVFSASSAPASAELGEAGPLFILRRSEGR
jgi:hypothetical protein